MVGGGSSGKGSGPPGRIRWVDGGWLVVLGHMGAFDRGHMVTLERGHMGLFEVGQIFVFVFGNMLIFVLGHILVMGGIGPPGGDGAKAPLRLVGAEV